MLIIALLLSIADPSSGLTFTGSSDIFMAQSESVLVYADPTSLSGAMGELVGEYSAATDTWSFKDGYDMNDVGRVLTGREATKEPSAETTTLWGAAATTGCWIGESGELDCGSLLGGDAGIAYDPQAFWQGAGTIEDNSTGAFRTEDGSISIADRGVTVATYDARDHRWRLTAPVVQPPPLAAGYVGWFGFFICLMLCVRLMMTTPLFMSDAPPAAPPPDGLLDKGMTALFGRSWRTGLSGFAGVALTVVAAIATVEPPYTFVKLAPLLPGLVASLGLMVAKDGKVSGLPK